jgi:hypothetical protein
MEKQVLLELVKELLCGEVQQESVGTPSGYCIVRTKNAGVFAGYIVKRAGQEVEMREARRLWYWKGAASLSQLSQEGVKCPDECKFPCPVTVTLFEVIEILPCTVQAQKSIEGVWIWQK